MILDPFRFAPVPSEYHVVSASVVSAGQNYPFDTNLPVEGGTYTIQAVLLPTHMTAVFVEVVSGGTGYEVDDQLTLTSGTGTLPVFNVDSVDENGAITALSIVSGGDLTVGPSNGNLTGGQGSGGTCGIQWGILQVSVQTAGAYTEKPTNPVNVENPLGAEYATFDLTWDA